MLEKSQCYYCAQRVFSLGKEQQQTVTTLCTRTLDNPLLLQCVELYVLEEPQALQNTPHTRRT